MRENAEKSSTPMTDMNDDFSAAQIFEINRGYESGVDVSIYRKPIYKQAQMRQIRLGLENGLSENEIGRYINPKFSSLNMEIIRMGLEKHFPVEKYASLSFDANQMWEIYIGFTKKLKAEDIDKYANPVYNAQQMQQIRLGLENGLSVDFYADPAKNAMEMELIRQRLFDNRKNTLGKKIKDTIKVWKG